MTLQRILEPEVMDSAEDAQEYNDMDHSEVNQKFVTEMLEFLSSNDGFHQFIHRGESDVPSPTDVGDDPDFDAPYLDVLDVGTGTALIPVELCERSPEFRVMAIDMAVSMLDLAQYNVYASHASNRIQLQQIDAKSMGFDDDCFDVVMSNSIIHHIPEPRASVEQMVRVLRPGGAVFVRDLMRPEDQETLDGLVEQYAAGESDYSQRLFRDSLHAALSLEEMQAIVAEFGFAANSVFATSDRHWTWAAFLPKA